LLLVAAVTFVAFGVFISLAYRQQWQWTGLPAPRAEDEGGSGRSAKTLWDWLQLLGIPVALAALAFLLNDAQAQRDQQREEQRAAQQQKRAVDAERESTLRAYLTQMSELMLNDNLLQSRPGADVRNVARTATLTAVRRLDGSRKGLVVRFLAEARLLPSRSSAPVVALREADLRKANLREANLFEAGLFGADLREANLGRADLRGANLREADLREANLVGADLREADLYRSSARSRPVWGYGG
jgi:Pentapeptide repeats (8 copies)